MEISLDDKKLKKTPSPTSRNNLYKKGDPHVSSAQRAKRIKKPNWHYLLNNTPMSEWFFNRFTPDDYNRADELLRVWGDNNNPHTEKLAESVCNAMATIYCNNLSESVKEGNYSLDDCVKFRRGLYSETDRDEIWEDVQKITNASNVPNAEKMEAGSKRTKKQKYNKRNTKTMRFNKKRNTKRLIKNKHRFTKKR
jgi:hypothetical protein